MKNAYAVTKSCEQQESPWLSLAIHPFKSLLLAGLLSCIFCPHTDDVN